jgi:small subunit ribosomal protein S4
MGNPRKFHKQYSRPGHPWQLARIEEERALTKEFGLKNKREIWKSQTQVKSFANDMKRLLALRTEQADVETKQLISHLQRIGLVAAGATSDDVLALTAKDLLARRLQSVIVKQGLAQTPKQARQFITHGHIIVGGKMVCAPSYIVPISEEPTITFVEKSVLVSAEHPARIKVERKPRAPPPEKRDDRRRGSRKPRTFAPKKEAPKKEASKGAKS